MLDDKTRIFRNLYGLQTGSFLGSAIGLHVGEAGGASAEGQRP